MPIYIYEVIPVETSLASGSDHEPEPVTFELLQSMSAAPLEFHPDTGQRVRRIIAPVNVAGLFSDMKGAKSLSDESLKAKGFTKYVKTGDGKYEKRLGSGPDIISRD